MANNSTYGVLNTKNFQQLLDDCAINNSFKAEVISLLRVSVPTFFTTYFDRSSPCCSGTYNRCNWF
ncbi:MAG: hypothetical protein ABIK42_03280 [candidate division WOR-3 bacterium]